MIKHELPNQAQISQVNGIVVMDVDNDGNQDILLAGNNYEREVETTRSDASIGCYLQGLGNGKFKYVSPKKSGLKIVGNTRSLLKVGGGGSTFIVAASNNEGVQLLTVVKN